MILGTDLNAPLGFLGSNETDVSDDDICNAFVGSYEADNETLASLCFQKILRKLDLKAVNTFYECGPTFFDGGRSSRIDFIAVPTYVEIHTCKTLAHAQAALQMSNRPSPQDHRPVFLRWVATPVAVTEAKKKEKLDDIKWDQDKIAEELHTGKIRAEFIEMVEDWCFRNERELVHEYRTAPATDFAWNKIVSAIRQIAAIFLGTKRGGSARKLSWSFCLGEI